MSERPSHRGKDFVPEADPQLLLSWYDANRRELAWRRDADPYRVLVSEVMLQQTRAEVVERRFDEFLARFPTLEALAEAEIDAVLAAWSGLGYYRRARNLHASARAIRGRGSWPRRTHELRLLPGVGDYTAAAVASISFGEPAVALDGNVRRLAARLAAQRGDPTRAAIARRLRREAARWLDPQRPGDSNQALMELGAMVCRPRPRCSICPLRGACRAYAVGDPLAFPGTTKKPTTIEKRWRLAVIEEGGRVWLVRRAETEGWLPGLFELPWVDDAGGDRPDLERRMAAKYGLPIRFQRRRGKVRHTIGRRSIRAEVWGAGLDLGPGRLNEAATADGRWVDPDRLDELATTSLVHKALAAAPS